MVCHTCQEKIFYEFMKDFLKYDISKIEINDKENFCNFVQLLLNLFDKEYEKNINFCNDCRLYLFKNRYRKGIIISFIYNYIITYKDIKNLLNNFPKLKNVINSKLNEFNKKENKIFFINIKYWKGYDYYKKKLYLN